MMTDIDIERELREKLTVSVDVAAAAFGIGRNSAYAAVKVGEIPSIRIGGKIAIPTAPLRRMLGMDNCSTFVEAAE